MKNITPDQTINKRYIIKSLIGKGGMGNVYLAEDTYKASHLIALKTINPIILRNREIIEKFKIEYEIMTRLKHPNLIEVYNFGFDEEASIHYIAMEYIQGNTLGHHINYDLLNFKEKIDIFIHLLRGIEFIHSRNIIYRDIKPENIIIENNNVKLMDFGLSDIGEVDQDKIKGSFLYFAPELFKKDADYRIDIFALGIVFYELITGDNLIQYNSVSSIIDILNSEDRFNNMHEKALKTLENNPIKQIIRKMTSYNKKDRYSSCMDIISDINNKLKTDYPYETDNTKISYIQGINFTNREKELALLKNHIFSKRSGAELLMISGNTGLGKSFLFSQLRKFCEMNDLLFFGVDCYRGYTQPFYVIEELFHQIQYYHKEPPPDIDSLRSLDAMNKIVSAQETNDINDHKQDFLYALVHYIIDLLYQSGRIIVFYINDINWIDNASLNIFLKLLMIMDQDEKLRDKCALFSSIREENKIFFKEQLSYLKRAKLLKIHNLKPFNFRNTTKYFKNAFGEKNLHRSIKENIRDINIRIGGNPYFLSEFLKYSINEDIIIKNKDKWELKGNYRDIIIPENIKDILKKRIRLLIDNPLQKKLLIIFTLTRIHLTMENIFYFFDKSKRESVKDHVLELELKDIILSRKAPKLSYIMAHSLIRDIIRETVCIKEKDHRLIAEGLEKAFFNDTDKIIEELAYHYKFTHNHEKSIYYLRRCGKLISRKYYDFNKILGYYNEALKMAETHLSKDHRVNPELYFDIGKTYFENADHRNALANYEYALSLMRRYHPDKKLQIKILNKIGLIQIYSDTRKAISTFHKAMAINIGNSREDNKKIIYSSINLANAYIKLDKHMKAEELLNQAYDLCLSHFLIKDPEMQELLYSIANLYFNTGKYQKSADHIKILIKNSEKMYGKLSIKTGTLLLSLGFLYTSLGQYNDALKTLRRSLRIQEKYYKTSHPKLIILYNAIGVLHNNLENHSNALKYLRKGLKLAREHYHNKQHSIKGDLLLNISNSYSYQNKVRVALKYALEALDIYKAYYGANHSQTAKVYNNIAILYNKSNQTEKAISYLKQSLNINKKIHKDNNPIIGINYLNIGVSYHRMGDFDNAVIYYKRSVNILIETLGEKHKYLANNYYNLSLCFYHKKQMKEALNYFEKGFHCAHDSLGIKHPFTQNIFQDMIRFLQKLNDHEKLKYYQEKYGIDSE